ncbi:MAG: hypothetical protein F4110_14085 [Acidimicrobiaceae bacterium]|nr:hypothetical protein [Acidimicrobiaceae bacterium]MXZ99976.1 hypothetical protein [Acidimicrobiaceae bacterium]MYE77295.1 hypothetical protein [Acidimicrobiaceae bacterium]MYE98129.1 hypothetical protein [Acidimicrobiaceae bacterium]MYI55087.1 hypothetical protein [Acidimicrobiaceae bacterium]
MNEREPRFDDTERQRAIERLRELQQEYAAAAEARRAAVYPAFERSEALRRLLRAHRDYDESTECVLEHRRMETGGLYLTAMARRRLVALWGGPVLGELDDPMRSGIADLVITVMASQLVLERALAAEGRELPAGSGTEAMQMWLADAVADLGDDEVFDLIADALRHATDLYPVDEMREDLGL